MVRNLFFVTSETDYKKYTDFLPLNSKYKKKHINVVSSLFEIIKSETSESVIIIDSDKFSEFGEDLSLLINKTKDSLNTFLLILTDKETCKKISNILNTPGIDILFNPIDKEILTHKISQIFYTLEILSKNKTLTNELKENKKRLNILTDIGKALHAEKDPNKLQELILYNARKIVGADSGSIYVVKDKDTPSKEKHLKFMLAQNDSIDYPFEQFKVNIDENSIAGHVTLYNKVVNIDDVYNIDDKSTLKFNAIIDREKAHKTRSVLTVPMSNALGEVIGVLQLINKKRFINNRLNFNDPIKDQILSFNENDIKLILTLAGQAAVSIENCMLYNEIQSLFKGFVKASVKAIESRDPTTSGHSERVSALTVNFAKMVSKVDYGPYKNVHFNEEEIQELEYATLLHDFGKVGVKENVLVKSYKLYENEFEIIKSRFSLIKSRFEFDNYSRRLKFLMKKGKDKLKDKKRLFDTELKKRFSYLDNMLHTISDANKPNILESEVKEELFKISKKTFKNLKGEEEKYITDNEIYNLKIPKGSLNETERKEIESHVNHSYDFLKMIPWTKSMIKIPQYAYAHHEYLNGTGYPRHIKAEDIPIQSRMMTIADIYDALTATDRPYKRALSAEKAIHILSLEAKDNKIDRELLNIFIESKIYELPD